MWEMERRVLDSHAGCVSVAFLLCSHSGLSPFLQEGPGESEGDETVAGYVPLCPQRTERQSAADGS